MAELIWTEPALADLDEMAGYIALSNLPAAKELVGGIFETVYPSAFKSSSTLGLLKAKVRT